METTLPKVVQAFLETATIEANGCVSVLIENDDHMQQAAEMLRTIKTRSKELNEKRLEITRPIDESKNQIMALFNPVQEKLKQGESILKAAILAYERKIAEENRLMQIQANKLAEEQAAAKAAAIIRDAEQAMDDDKPELALAYVAKAEEVKPVSVNVAAQRRPSGISIPKHWKHRVINPELVPPEFRLIDEKKLAKYATAMKESAKVPGVEFYEEATVSAKSF